MIDLTYGQIIGEGEVRVCYQHPDRKDLCIKVTKQQSVHSLKKRTIGNIFRKLILPKLNIGNPNAREYNAYQAIKKKSAYALTFITPIYSLEQTTYGLGLVSKKTPQIETLEDQLLSKSNLTEENEKLVIDMLEALLKEEIYLFDLNLKNIAFITQNNRRSITLLDIKDYMNPKGIIPLEKYIPILARKKMIRRSQRLLNRIGIKHTLT